MRWVVWCAACCLLACGKSQRDQDSRSSSSRGGEGTAGSAGLTETGGGAGHEAEGGNPGSGGDRLAGSAGTGGGTVVDGGRGPSAGASGALPGGSTGSGGAAGAPVAGKGGELASAGTGAGGNVSSQAGAAGTTGDACQSGVLCGCGCCEGESPSNACFYPDRGDTFQKLTADDEALAMSPSCEGVDCAQGIFYWCCVPPAEPQTATYRTDSYHTDGGDRFVIIRADEANNCTALAVSSTIAPPKFPIQVPEGWKVDVGSSGFNCNEIYNFPNQRIAIGGEGFVAFTTPDRCAIDFDFTLYFNLTSEDLVATRFVGQGVATPNLGSDCN